jgi:hypothetical protein
MFLRNVYKLLVECMVPHNKRIMVYDKHVPNESEKMSVFISRMYVLLYCCLQGKGLLKP